MALFGSIAANANFSQLTGTATNDSASAGNVGETVTSILNTGSSTSMTTATDTDITSITLTAGDWDVYGQVNLKYASATQSADAQACFNSAVSMTTNGSEGYDNTRLTTTSCIATITPARIRWSSASGFTMHLVAKATFSAGTCSGFGFIQARRVR